MPELGTIDADDLSDEELLEAVERSYQDALTGGSRLGRTAAFNRFHDYRYEAAERGLRDKASEITETVRQKRASKED